MVHRNALSRWSVACTSLLLLLVACGPAAAVPQATRGPDQAAADLTPIAPVLQSSPATTPDGKSGQTRKIGTEQIPATIAACPSPSADAIGPFQFNPVTGRDSIAYTADGVSLFFVESRAVVSIHSLVRHRLTGKDGDLAWSPDSSRIAFVYGMSDPPACAFSFLMLADLQSGVVRPLTLLPEGSGQPVWSPDGNRIALTDAKGRLEIVEASTGKISVQILDVLGRVPPTWIDSGHIAYARRLEPTGRVDLVRQALDGSAPTVMVADLGDLSELALSPRQERLAYYRGTLVLMVLGSRATQSLGLEPSERLQWSPDGRSLLGRGGLAGVFIVQADASASVSQLPLLGLPGTAQSWAPDSQRFALLAGPEGRPPHLALYDLNAARLTDLSVEVQSPFDLAWSTR